MGSIEEWGWTIPILVDEKGMIIAGHGRVMAAEKLGLTEVPVMIARGWSDSKKRAYVIADNKLARNSSWDNDLLIQELGDIASDGFNLDIVGFNQNELDALLQSNPADLMDPTDGEGQTQGDGQAMLSWGKTKVPLTAEEIAMLERAYADHVAVQGVSYGFVRSLILRR